MPSVSQPHSIGRGKPKTGNHDGGGRGICLVRRRRRRNGVPGTSLGKDRENLTSKAPEISNRFPVSARKLAARMRKFPSPELRPCGGSGGDDGGNSQRSPSDNLAIKDQPSVQDPEFLLNLEARKSDSRCEKLSTKLCDQNNVNDGGYILKAKLKKAWMRIKDVEAEQGSPMEKVTRLLEKFGEERMSWLRRENEKLHSTVEDLKKELKKERKNREKMELMKSKLFEDIASVSISLKKITRDYQEEKRARKLMEQVCDDMMEKIKASKKEIKVLKRERTRATQELEKERKMMQTAEVWREERVRLKLMDANVILEEKYSQMNSVLAKLEDFMRSRDEHTDSNKIRHMVSSVNLRDNLKKLALVENVDTNGSEVVNHSPKVTVAGCSKEQYV